MGRSVSLGMGSLFTAFVMCIALFSGPSAATSRSMTHRPSDRPTTHHLYWTVENKNVTKNNETVAVATVNGILPGPTVHLNEGDTLVVNVMSKVESDVTIHWHGIKQMLTNWADGPSHITQCPLKKGQSMIYEFTVTNQSGTYFWHAHVHWLRATVYGAFIVHPRASPPYVTPVAEIPITFGEWYPETPTGIASHGPSWSPQYTASTLNGLLGPLYNTSHGDQGLKVEVVSGKTYLLRLINAALNSDFYFAIANHNMTVVAADGEYVKEFTASEVLLSPGQTTDVLVTANQPKGKYYFGIGEWSSNPVSDYIPPPPALGFLQYTSGSSSPARLTSKYPTFPSVNATADLAKAFQDKLYGLANYSLPQRMDREFVFAASVANIVCKAEENCTTKTGATINNSTFDNPVNTSILESYYYDIKGKVYGTDFPTLPPAIVNFTSNDIVAAYNLTGNRGAKVVTLKYNETVELVLQDLNGSILEDHPFHLHGHNFYVVGRGSGNFNGSHDPGSFNLVDPPMRNTVALPKAGWVAIWFIANNPGVWFFHCHIERHVSWGMMMAFITENGNGAASTLPSPKHSMPKCNTVSIKH